MTPSMSESVNGIIFKTQNKLANCHKTLEFKDKHRDLVGIYVTNHSFIYAFIWLSKAAAGHVNVSKNVYAVCCMHKFLL